MGGGKAEKIGLASLSAFSSLLPLSHTHHSRFSVALTAKYAVADKTINNIIRRPKCIQHSLCVRVRAGATNTIFPRNENVSLFIVSVHFHYYCYYRYCVTYHETFRPSILLHRFTKYAILCFHTTVICLYIYI